MLCVLICFVGPVMFLDMLKSLINKKDSLSWKNKTKLYFTSANLIKWTKRGKSARHRRLCSDQALTPPPELPICVAEECCQLTHSIVANCSKAQIFWEAEAGGKGKIFYLLGFIWSRYVNRQVIEMAGTSLLSAAIAKNQQGRELTQRSSSTIQKKFTFLIVEI